MTLPSEYMCDASNFDIGNYLVISVIPLSFYKLEKKLKSEAKYYVWGKPFLCFLDIEIPYVLEFCHSSPFGLWVVLAYHL